MKNMFKLLIAVITALSFSALNAKEPTNFMFGIGGGIGSTSIEVKHSHIIRNPSYSYNTKWDGSFGQLVGLRWPAQQNASLSSTSGAWEFLVGYKYFANDWFGFRGYVNIGVQHYKPSLFQSKTDPIALVDYTANVDLLIDFYETEKWAIGMVAGLGIGGTSFDKKAIDKYMVIYNAQTKAPVGKTDIQSTFLNIDGSVGLRGVYFQKVRRLSERVCGEEYKEGKRLCRVPIHYVGHNFEINAKFPFMPYKATSNPDVIVSGDVLLSRPQYVVKNPYRITFRYIVDF